MGRAGGATQSVLAQVCNLRALCEQRSEIGMTDTGNSCSSQRDTRQPQLLTVSIARSQRVLQYICSTTHRWLLHMTATLQESQHAATC